jgi:KAP family P-loop domain
MVEERRDEEAGPALASGRIALWDDNPATVDLLGFETVVSAIEGALSTDHLDPLTIGVHSPWGGGKTTVLGLLQERLDRNVNYVVVRTDPWEYDDTVDVRGTLIAEVLHALEVRFAQSADAKQKIRDLISRISWSRVGVLVAKGAITMQWNPTEIVEAFTPKPRETPESMAGFRDAFAALLRDLVEVRRVVVLVDDLDRCLPDAVMATLEAIKLFLSAEKMTFVLAADQDMVRDAIAASLDASGRSDIFANRYLEKIVQLPVSLPRLSAEEAETYIALLLADWDSPDQAAYDALVAHCTARRQAGRSPLLAALDELAYRPSAELLSLAGRLAAGLSADRVSNPRQIKRFLNAFGIRAQVAKAHGITLAPDVIAKLLLLEDRFRADFEHLVALADEERQQLLTQWEAWADGERDDPPEGISDATREWAASEPTLTDKPLSRYLTLAASLTSLAAGASLSDELAQLVVTLSGPSITHRDQALTQIAERSTSERRSIAQALLARARRVEDLGAIITSLIGIAKATPELADEIADGIREQCWQRIEPGPAYDLATSEVPALVALAQRLKTDDTVEPDVREAAAAALEP